MTRLHPLFGAEQRVDRAAQHIGELRERLQEWADLHPKSLKPTLDPETGRWSWEEITPLPVEELGKSSVVIGDALFNLRASLDYLVYQLAVLGKREEVFGSQFPIEDSRDMFEGRITGKHPGTKKKVAHYLRYVPDGAIELIRVLQPCYGCGWTAQLRDLSNPDKHRTLSALSSRGEWYADVGGVATTETDEGTTIEIGGHFQVAITFGRGGPDALDTLELLEREVRETVALFKRGFDMRPVSSG